MKAHPAVSVAILAVLVQFSGCSKSPPTPAGRSGPPAQLANTMFLSAPPADAKEVGAGKKDVAKGARVSIHGRIGGRKDPFVSGRAMFMLADISLPPCSDDPNDGCKTPWDYCCEPKDKITANTVTVRVLDAAGAVLTGELNGVHGLRPLAEVVVQGQVSKESEGSNVVIDAAAFYVKPG